MSVSPFYFQYNMKFATRTRGDIDLALIMSLSSKLAAQDFNNIKEQKVLTPSERRPLLLFFWQYSRRAGRQPQPQLADV